jgi:hypothetical protein
VAPNLIQWVPAAGSFVITDKSSNGALGGTTNGQIFRFAPSFNSGDGSLSSFGAGSLLIRGNTNSGTPYTETQYATMLPSGVPSTDPSVYIYQVASLAYNINQSGYVNYYAGNGTLSLTGYLVKFYDATTGSTDGGL